MDRTVSCYDLLFYSPRFLLLTSVVDIYLKVHNSFASQCCDRSWKSSKVVVFCLRCFPSSSGQEWRSRYKCSSLITICWGFEGLFSDHAVANASDILVMRWSGEFAQRVRLRWIQNKSRCWEGTCAYGRGLWFYSHESSWSFFWFLSYGFIQDVVTIEFAETLVM